MTAFVCLTIAVLCALISRVLLLIAAIRISVWWAIGVFLPFGPMFFRLNYPDQARPSFIFRIGTLGAVFLYVLLGPAAGVSLIHKTDVRKPSGNGYALDFANRLVGRSKTDTLTDTRSLTERRAANEQELERLNRWSDALRVQKRDLLRSDLERNRAYNVDLQEYQAAFAAAMTEKQALAIASGGK